MRINVLFRCLTVAGALASFGGRPVPAQESKKAEENEPLVSAASDEPERALQSIRLTPGLKAQVFAAEPMLANPVAFCIDEKGRFYVAETFRHTDGVTDTRSHMEWLDDDLASRTVEDRVAMYKKYLPKEVLERFVKQSERVRRIEDVDGDGKADRTTVFADGFSDLASGIGAGLLARGDAVWFACIPDLWMLKDTNGDGKADERKIVHHGYGVHVAFIGHDLHGLRMGPDGRLYFSIGDRGLNVKTGGRTVAFPDGGAVLRCEPDGSNLEIFSVGLRNPQELAFDKFGNLFTGDNNSDGGDKARWVYVVEGGDSGWRIGYQYLEEPNSRGPWNAEKMWHPQWEGQPASLIPPIANVADGPSGLTYNPGVAALPDRYADHFFLADFRGASGQSGVRSFAVKSKGAGFELIDSHEFAWGVLATDVDFGPDGALYVSDWVEGWQKPSKGRLYKVSDPEKAKLEVMSEVKKRLAEGTSKQTVEELGALLGHADMRVRLEAQYELASRSIKELAPGAARRDSDPTIVAVGNAEAKETGKATAVLAREANHGPGQIVRLHAIWGLGQTARACPGVLGSLDNLLDDPDPEVRALVAKVIGDVPPALQGTDDSKSKVRTKLIGRLKDESPRARFFAAIALAKFGRADAASIAPVLAMLRENADKDVYIRHAGVTALTATRDTRGLVAAASDESSSARMGALLALRRLASPEIAVFLKDKEPRLVVEAARAINDVPINDAMPQLAAMIDTPKLTDPFLLSRVLNANFRAGQATNARALAAFAARNEVPQAVRVEALEDLENWQKPSGRDRVVGLWRPLQHREAATAAEALGPQLDDILKTAPDAIRQAGAKAAGSLLIKTAGPALLALLDDKKASGEARAQALKSLAQIGDDQLPKAADLAVASTDPELRIEGQRILAMVRPAEAVKVLEKALEGGPTVERQGVLSILGELKLSDVDAVFVRWLDRLLAGKVPSDIQLDLLEAAAKRPSAEVKERLAKYESTQSKGGPLDRYWPALAGGNFRRGLRIFATKAEVACLRCHKVQIRNGEGFGGEVGPSLTDVGSRESREYILESIVDPNKKIAKGFESVVLALDDGRVVTGILKSEDDKTINLMTAEGLAVAVPKADVEDRKRGASAMPDDVGKHLSMSEIRDLVEFLSSMKSREALGDVKP